MGKILAEIRITNYSDVILAEIGTIDEKDIKTEVIYDAIVDSGATLLSLSENIIRSLGLKKRKSVKVNTASGVEERGIYDPVVLEIMGREGLFEVMELKHPQIKALVGQIPLERLDFLIKPSVNRLIPDPDHGNQLMLDQLLTDKML